MKALLRRAKHYSPLALYLVKSPGARQVIFYIMAIWGMIIAVVSGSS